MQGQSILRRMGRALKGLAALLLALVLAGLCYLAVILVSPEGEESPQAAPVMQPLAAAPSVAVQQEEELRTIAATMPAPVLRLMSGSGLRFVSALAADTAWEGQLARVATVTYQTPEGKPLQLQTIVPAGALSQLETGWELMGQGAAIGGLPSVRMERGDEVRLHAQGEEALYVVQASGLSEERMSQALRSLQLMEEPCCRQDRYGCTRVPTFSPRMRRVRLPGAFMSKTMMGIPPSEQRA